MAKVPPIKQLRSAALAVKPQGRDTLMPALTFRQPPGTPQAIAGSSPPRRNRLVEAVPPRLKPVAAAQKLAGATTRNEVERLENEGGPPLTGGAA